jgi:photosystem II stability/assembly factor-like uncharacterized protein
MKLKSNMNKPLIAFLCISSILVQCRSKRQPTQHTAYPSKPSISLQVEPSGAWQALGPFGAPEPMAENGEMSPHGAGRFMCVDIHPEHPSEILAGHATSGLFKTKDHGRTWEQKLKFSFATGIFNIVRFKRTPDHLIACSALDIGNSRQYGYGLLESFDNGETWTRNSLQFEPEEYKLQQCRDIAIIDAKKEKRLIAISDKDIFLSEDGAKTWKKILETGLIIKNIVVNPFDEQSIFICGNGVLYSRDGGMSWKNITNDISASYGKQNSEFARFLVAFSQKDKNRFYVAAEDPHVMVLKSSIDSLGKYTLVNRNACLANATRLAFVTRFNKKTGHESIYIGTTRVYASDDLGLHFTQISNPEKGMSNSVHDDINAIVCLKDNLYLATDGGVDMSADGGNSWTSLTASSTNLNTSMIFGFDKSRRGYMMCGTQDNGILTLRNGNWYCSPMYGDGGRAVAVNDSTGFAVGYAQSNYITSNAGRSFEYKHAGSERTGHDFRMSYHQQSSTFYLANQHLYKKKDGKYFEILTSRLDGSRKIKAFWVNPTNEKEIWVCKDDPTWGAELKDKLFYTNTGGRIWHDYTEKLPILNWRSITDIFINKEGQIAITLEAFDKNGTEPNKVYFSNDGGSTFVNGSEGLPNVPANCITYAWGEWICGTNQGVYVLKSGVWQPFGTGFPPSIVTELKYFEEDGILYASTFGRGIWGIKLLMP